MAKKRVRGFTFWTLCLTMRDNSGIISLMAKGSWLLKTSSMMGSGRRTKNMGKAFMTTSME